MPVGQAQEKPVGWGKQRWEQPPLRNPHLLKPLEVDKAQFKDQCGSKEQSFILKSTHTHNLLAAEFILTVALLGIYGPAYRDCLPPKWMVGQGEQKGTEVVGSTGAKSWPLFLADQFSHGKRIIEMLIDSQNCSLDLL